MIVTAIIKKKRLDNKELEKYEYNTHEMLGVSPKELMDISTELFLLKYLQQNSNSYSIQREMLMKMIS